MAFRYRKSINLGGGFRVNLSKSGIGYSWGVKGYRITNTSKGTTRRTVSIPGTGMSWVNESKNNKSKQGNVKSNPQDTANNNIYDTEHIANEISGNMVSDGMEEMLTMAKRTLKWNKIANISIFLTLLLSITLPIFIILLILAIVLKIFVKTKGIIELEYIIDSDQAKIVEDRIKPLQIILNSNKLWRVLQSSKVVDKKYTSGASNLIKRSIIQANTKAPFPFKTNTSVVTFRDNKEILFFLPDKLFIMKGSNIGVLSYSDFTYDVKTTNFVESGVVPKDAIVTGKTWKYVNKTGGPDKRFKDNRELPICKYGQLLLNSSKGLNTVIMFSNSNMF